LHQVGTSSLLIYMMHGHTYIKFIKHYSVATYFPMGCYIIFNFD